VRLHSPVLALRCRTARFTRTMLVTTVSHSVPATTDFARNTSTVLVSCRLRALQTETLLLAGRLAVQAATVSFSRVG
jgi:hypothetical protein